MHRSKLYYGVFVTENDWKNIISSLIKDDRLFEKTIMYSNAMVSVINNECFNVNFGGKFILINKTNIFFGWKPNSITSILDTITKYDIDSYISTKFPTKTSQFIIH